MFVFIMICTFFDLCRRMQIG